MSRLSMYLAMAEDDQSTIDVVVGYLIDRLNLVKASVSAGVFDVNGAVSDLTAVKEDIDRVIAKIANEYGDLTPPAGDDTPPPPRDDDQPPSGGENPPQEANDSPTGSSTPDSVVTDIMSKMSYPSSLYDDIKADIEGIISQWVESQYEKPVEDIAAQIVDSHDDGTYARKFVINDVKTILSRMLGDFQPV